MSGALPNPHCIATKLWQNETQHIPLTTSIITLILASKVLLQSPFQLIEIKRLG